MAAHALLTAERISHTYRTPGGDVPALDDVTLRLSGASFVCLVGPSGCGKSTLLRILGGLLPPDGGRVLLDGHLLTRAQRRVGVVFQKANLMPWRTVAGNLALPLELARIPPVEREERTQAMLELTGLEGFAGAYPGALSGGMAQRVAIGRALIHDPQVLLLDEPFGALDALTREQMSEELLRIWACHRKTVLMVTHSIPEAVLLADRVLVMGPRPGHLIAEVPVPLARPRSLALLHQPDFVALTEQVRRSIRSA